MKFIEDIHGDVVIGKQFISYIRNDGFKIYYYNDTLNN